MQSELALKQMLPVKGILCSRMHPPMGALAALGAFPASTAGLVSQQSAQSSQSSAVGTAARLACTATGGCQRRCLTAGTISHHLASESRAALAA